MPSSGNHDPQRDAGAPIGVKHWMALAAALLGWLFDGAEMGVFSLVGRPAIKDLLGGDIPEKTIGIWFGVVTAGFLVGAATGGVLFGWLGDRIGRVRAMSLSILTYALFTGACGLAGDAWHVGLLRFIAALGMGGEWSLGVALVMEIWPNRSRAFMAGLIGAAANVGYLLVGVLGLGLNSILPAMQTWFLDVGLREDWVDMLTANGGWRLLMMAGAAPALLTFLIRLFVPESEKWQKERASGATSHWATHDLLAVIVGAVGPVTIIYLWAERPEPFSTAVRLGGSALGLAVAVAGYIYPVARYVQRMGADTASGRVLSGTLQRMLLAASLSGVALLGTWGSAQWIPSWADKLTTDHAELHAKEYAQMCAALGAIVGTIAAALTGDWLGRRVTYVLLCALSLASVVWLFQFHRAYSGEFLLATFFVGACTGSFYGWLPLYLPELFRTSVRATAQGFGFNFGRILAAIGALQVGNLMSVFENGATIGGVHFDGGYPLACTAMSLIYVVGMAVIWLAPETHGQPLPD